MGVPLLVEDWCLRVFVCYGLVDIPPGRLYVNTIFLPGCMDRCSRYTPFSDQY